MKNSPETNYKAGVCEHCLRGFSRESSFFKHICEQKRRWLDREKPGNRIGYLAWKNYFNRHHPGKKNTEYSDFYRSNYYTAFVKFGNYCVGVNAINPGAYSTWLVANKVPIDNWSTDSQYTPYLVEYLRTEDHLDAVRRTLDVLLDQCSGEGLRIEDVFKYLNTNKILQLITAGRVSPWVLYQCNSGIEWLAKLDRDQTALIFDYINPERWNIKFRREQEAVATVKNLLKELGL